MTNKLAITIPEPETFEDVLENLGGLGLFQILILAALLSFEIPTAFTGFSAVFIGNLPEYWICNSNQTISRNDACSCNGTLSAPQPYTTIVAEWNLVCEKSWISDFINSIQMVGMIVGILTAAQMADWYGRHHTTLGSGFVVALGSAISAIAPNPYVFALGRLMIGAGWSALQNITGIYALEFLPIKWRALVGCAGPYGWATAILGLIAYFIRPWRSLVWLTATPLLVICPVMLFVPESPRYLLGQRRMAELDKVLRLIAKVNRREVINIEVLETIADKEFPLRDSTNPTTKASYLDLFRQPELRYKTICFSAFWFSWALVYFGVYLNIKNVPGNIFINVAFMGLADIIGFPLAMLLLNRYGRRTSVLSSMSLGAIFLVILSVFHLILEPKDLPMITLALCTLGKFGLAIARCSAKCFTAESFPTFVRSIGTGVTASILGLGATICPQIVYIGMFSPAVPFFVFAVISVIGSIFAYLCKETSGQPLQESVIIRKLSIINSIILSPAKSKGMKSQGQSSHDT